MLKFFTKDVGIDLGTSNILIYLSGKGMAVNESSIVAVNNKTNQLLAAGIEARKMLGRTPSHVEIVKPLVNGIISDFEVTQEMLKFFLRRINRGPLSGYRRAVVGVPSNLTEVERKSVEDAVIGAGISKA